MATRNQDVQLNIRAVDYSKKTTDQVVGSLKALNKAQDEQIDSAKKGIAAGADLEKSYNNIAGAIKALADQDKLIKSFDAQNLRLETAKQRLEAAQAAQAAFNATLAGADQITDKQATKIERLGRAVSGAQVKLDNAQSALANTTARLATMGVESDKTAEAQEKISTTIGESIQVLARLRNAYSGLGAAQAERNKRLEEESQAEKQVAVDIAFANAQREAEAEADRKLLAAQKAIEDAREKELNTERQFVAAQAEVIAGIQREEAARRAQVAAINAATAAANAAKVAAASTARPAAAAAPQSNLAAQLRDIGDPAAAAARNVDNLERSITGLEASVTAISGPVENYRDLLNQARTAQAGLQQVASNVDAYNRQITALRAARAEYVAQRTALNNLVAALRAGTGGQNILSQIERQQGALQNSARALNDVTVAARATRAALDAAGVDTANMTAAERQLADQATRTAAAMRNLNTAFNENGEAAQRGAAGLTSWFGGGRTTLSYAQRIRGELLGLAAAFVGVNATVELAKDTLDTYNKFQALQSRLLVAAGGDAKQAADDYSYLVAQSQRFGFVLLDIGGAYAKFAIAGKAANFTVQETRYVFEQFASAAKNARLSTAEFEGILKAVEQMMSKGTIQAEELRGQLGDRLPGAFAIAAKAAGKTTAEYAKMLELGQVGSERVIEIARGVGEAYGVIAESGDTLLQVQAKFQNASDLFKKAIAENGFVDAYSEFLTKLTEIISGDSGQELATQLAGAFKAILQVVTLLIENFDTLKLALQVIIGLKLFSWALQAAEGIAALRMAMLLLNREIYALAGSGIVRTIVALGGASATAAGGVSIITAAFIALRTAVMVLLRAIPYVGIALAALSLISFVWDKFFNEDDAKKAGAKAGKAGANAAANAATAVPPKRDASYDMYTKSLDDRAKQEAALDQKILEARRQGAKKNLGERLKFVDQEYDVQRQAAKATITDKTALELRLNDIQGLSNKAQLAERIAYNNETAQTDESAAKKRIRLAEEVATALKQAQDDIEKREGDADPTKSFAERTLANQKAVQNAYDKTASKINELRKLDAPTANAAASTLSNLKEQRVEVQKRVDASAEVARLDKQISAEMAIQKAQIDAIQARAGELTPEEVIAQTNAAISATAPKIQKLGADTIAFAQSVKDLLTPTELAQALSRGTIAISKNNSDAIQSANNLAAAQTALNVILDDRQRQLDIINTKEKLRMITSDEAAAESDRVYASFKQKVLDAAEAVTQLVEVTRDLKGAPVDSLNATAAAMANLTLQTKNQLATTTALGAAIESSILNQGMTAFDSLSDAVGKVALGQMSLADGFRAAARAAAAFFAGLLRDIAAAIAKQQILNAISSYGSFSGSAAGAGASNVAPVGAMHTGGAVGTDNSFSRMVNPGVFMGAPRFHEGGFPGLRSDEVPTILQKGEQVLARDDPKNPLNGGGAAPGAGGTDPSSVRFVLTDDRSSVPQAMQSSAGEKVIVMAIKNNLPTLRQWLNK